MGRIREVLTDEDIKKIEESYDPSPPKERASSGSWRLPPFMGATEYPSKAGVNKPISEEPHVVGQPNPKGQDLPNRCHESNIVIEVDDEFGNMLIKVGDKAPKKSSEGVAFVTIGVDENGEVTYISIEPEDEELARFIRKIKVG